MKYVDNARSPGSALRVLTSSERLANQLKSSEIGEVGKRVKKIEMDAPKIGNWRHGTNQKFEKSGNRLDLVKRSARNLSNMRCWQELVKRKNSSSV